MEKHSKIIKEFIDNQNLTDQELAKVMGLKYRNVFYEWENGGYPRLKNAIVFANYFNCSLDYLFGRIDYDYDVKNFKDCPPFDKQLRKVLKEKGVSQQKLMRDTNIKNGHLYNWFNKKVEPKMDTLIILADHLGVSLDYLVGREK